MARRLPRWDGACGPKVRGDFGRRRYLEVSAGRGQPHGRGRSRSRPCNFAIRRKAWRFTLRQRQTWGGRIRLAADPAKIVHAETLDPVHEETFSARTATGLGRVAFRASFPPLPNLPPPRS